MTDRIYSSLIPSAKPEVTGQFFITDSKETFKPFYPDIDVFEARFTLSSKQIKKTRKVYQLLDMIGDIGGFSDAIFMIFEFLMGSYAPGLFMSSLIKSLYRVDLFTPRSD